MCQDILGGFEMKNKYKIISKIDCEKWINVSNLLAKSLINHNEALLKKGIDISDTGDVVF